MKALIRTSESSYIRTLLLISALVTLCISEGVGLQLLPIPSAPGVAVSVTEARLLKVRTDVPSPPSREKSIAGRVEIMAPKLEELSHQESIQIHTAAILTVRYFDFTFSYAVSSSQEPTFGYSGIFGSQGVSRAPPFRA